MARAARQRPVLDSLTWLTAAAAARRPRVGPLRNGIGAGRFQHGEWTALLSRFTHIDGTIDYGTMVRVRRLVEVYLRRLADADPETFADADDQLAFYLNAYNAIAVHQVLLSYPVRSIRQIPGALTRPYPIGRRNVSLNILHASVLRTFGDPRIHTAINPATRGSGPLQPQAFSGSGLQHELDAAMRRLLNDPAHGARLDVKTKSIYISSIFRLFGGDFLQPHTMPSPVGLAAVWMNTAPLVMVLAQYLPSELAIAVRQNQPDVRFLPYDWTLNDRVSTN
ncbi:MAG TPA: DUF547 domain-containing protein [Herpetosiphonaceae bacterium]